MQAKITEHQDITIAISGSLMSELLKRFEEEKKEYLDLSSFCSWALRYYLQRAYLPEKESPFYRG